MLKIIYTVLITLLIISCGGNTDNQGETENSTNIESDDFEDNTHFKQDIAAYKTVVNIIRETGLAQNFVILPGNVKNVVAYVQNNERILEYNPEFMQQLEGDTNWHGISVLAREIGHHLSHHDLKNGISTIAEDLEADRYAGFVLQKMGASLEEAIQAIENLNTDDKNKGASVNARIAALTQGWTNSKLLSSDTTSVLATVEKPQKTTEEDKNHVVAKRTVKPEYLYQVFLAIDTNFYYINDRDVVFQEKNGKYNNVGEKRESNKPGFDWIFIKGDASYGVDAKGRLWAFSTDGKFHVVGQSVKLDKGIN